MVVCAECCNKTYGRCRDQVVYDQPKRELIRGGVETKYLFSGAV